jgi:hypothetical protein
VGIFFITDRLLRATHSFSCKRQPLANPSSYFTSPTNANPIVAAQIANPVRRMNYNHATACRG